MSEVRLGAVNAAYAVNGVEPASVDAVVERFRADPASADVGFAATVEWVDGYRTQAVAGGFGPVDGDEPVDLAGGGTAPAPEDLLLAAVGQCLVVGIVGAASARGLTISALRVTARGRVDLSVAYGLADGHPGFSSIDVAVDLAADLPRAELDELVRRALARAPIPNTVMHPVPVRVELDAGDRAGSSWAGHYDALRLNTVAWTSHLPGLRFGRAAGPYPRRDQVVEYLARYVEHHRLDVRWSTRVAGIERVGAHWRVHAAGLTVHSGAVVIATGSCGRPRLPDWPGQEVFPGRILHSTQYRCPDGFRGRRVLVVGAGNSGGEIAADLAAGGAAAVRLSVRGAPQVIPRRVWGVPTVLVAIATRRLPAAVGDAAARLLRRAVLGDLGEHGLVASTRPLSQQYARGGVVPLSHPGFFAHLRRGEIEVVPAVERLSAAGVHLADGRVIDVDDVIAAIGFETGLRDLLGSFGILDAGEATGLRRALRGRARARRDRFHRPAHRQPPGDPDGGPADRPRLPPRPAPTTVHTEVISTSERS